MDHPRPVVGVVGAGQLARMCWQAAIGLDIDLRVLAARSDDAAATVLPNPRFGDPADPDALRRFAAACDVLTLDHELVDLATLRALEAEGCVVRPGADALRFAQDKAFQRTSFRTAGLPVPDFVVTDSLAAARAFAADHGWPVVCKRPRGGYDGRGVWIVHDAAELAAVWADIPEGDPVLVEQRVELEREVAVLIARRPGGEHTAAPLIETVQHDGMLRALVVPAPVPAAVAQRALGLATRIVELVGVVGICAIELFWTGGDLLINEIATRPHNSGHWTIDGAVTSQFVNHLRAVLDLPVGSMAATAPAVCSVNVVGGAGAPPPGAGLARALAVPDVAVHLYGKSARPGRKLGHVTAVADDVAAARRRAGEAASALAGEGAVTLAVDGGSGAPEVTAGTAHRRP
ncbi:MAG: 5-(carboxyamino)imidazole ribonucleotide synthase [Actinobacteria bacterium]|nr:5-(carboxyamino)imidazole ribonucleotide synthase [Actinomycetota bacterium]